MTKGERAIAKMINFGIIYGISAFGLSENLEIPREQAQEYIDAYLARFPHVQDFIARTIEEAARDGYVTSLLGRRRPVPEIRAQNRQTRSLGERLAVNFVMQGSNADIIKVAMIRIHRRLRDEGRSARLVLQVHDELLLEAPDAEVAAVKELVREEMCGAYDLDPPLAVDVGAGRRLERGEGLRVARAARSGGREGVGDPGGLAHDADVAVSGHVSVSRRWTLWPRSGELRDVRERDARSDHRPRRHDLPDLPCACVGRPRSACFCHFFEHLSIGAAGR